MVIFALECFSYLEVGLAFSGFLAVLVPPVGGLSPSFLGRLAIEAFSPGSFGGDFRFCLR